MRGPRLLVAAAAMVAVAGTAVTFPTAVPAHAAACEQGSGVTVVVDFASLGGGIQTTCAPGDPGTGLEALRGAGHEPTRAAQQAGYFVCRIDGKPANDPCQRTSPQEAYWSYWTGRPGGSWTYSNVGPADSDPEPGTVEGWAFGAGKPPSSPPPQEGGAAPAPAPSPTRASSPSARAPAPTSPATSDQPAAAGSPTASSPSASASPSASPSVSPSATPSATPSTSSSASPEAAAAPTDSPVPGPIVVDRLDDDGPGSLVGALVALALVLLLAAAGTYQLQQRRRDSAL